MKTSRQQLIVGALVIGGLVFLFTRKGHHTDNLKAQVGSGSTKPAAVIVDTTQATTPQTDPAAHTAQVKAALRAAQQELASGFIAAPLAAGALPVHVVKLPVCHWGDLDLIREELQQKPAMSLLLSLEPLDPAARSPQAVSVKLTYQQLLADYRGRLALPSASAPTAMGLFICSDASGEASCGRKVREDLSGAFALVVHKGVLKVGAVRKLPVDRVYYFQNLLLDQGQLKVEMAPVRSPKAAPIAAQYLASKLGAAAAKGAATKALANRKALSSMPVLFERGELQIQLPFEDVEHCGPVVAQAAANRAAPLPQPRSTPQGRVRR